MPLGAHKAAIMGVAGTAAAADVVLLYDTDHSDAASASISSGIDSTYGEYIFGFYNMNPVTDTANFQFQVNVDGESGYNETITSAAFRAYHKEDDSSAALGYGSGLHQNEGTAFQSVFESIGNGADESCAGTLHLFNPSNTTYVKHWYSRCVGMWATDVAVDHFLAGYFNVTGAIDDIQFKMSTGNFDGTIKMWGVK
jgi:hypothetical protein